MCVLDQYYFQTAVDHEDLCLQRVRRRSSPTDGSTEVRVMRRAAHRSVPSCCCASRGNFCAACASAPRARIAAAEASCEAGAKIHGEIHNKRTAA